MIKKIASLAAAGTLFLGSALPVLAADCGFSLTGPYSNNQCNRHKTKTSVYTHKSLATIVKNQSSTAKSGDNVQDYNTAVTGGGIDTDDAESEIDPVAYDTLTDPQTGFMASTPVFPTTDVNTTELDVDQTVGGDSPTGNINTSGPFSNNQINMVSDKTAVVGVDNTATVMVNQTSIAKSGGNSISYNTSTSGELKTGKATSKVSSNLYVNWTSVSISQ